MSEKLLEWLNEQLAKAEQALHSREQGAAIWGDGSDATWKSVAVMAGSKFIPKKQRLQNADTERRIAVKCRRDVEMFKATIVLVTANGKESA